MQTINLLSDADRERMERLAAAKTTARCGECGCNWELQRGDAFRCPFCATTFTLAYLSQGGNYVELEPRAAPAGA